MPATSTAYNACDASVYLKDGTGALRDISGSSNRVNISLSQETEQYAVFGSEWLLALACRKSGTISLDVVCSTAANEAKDVLYDWWTNDSKTPRTFRVIAPENAAGSDDYQAEVLITSLDLPIDGTTAGPVMLTAEFIVTGEVNIDTTTT